MSLNPPLNSNRHPYRKEGEYFLMKRDSIEFEIDIQGAKKYTGKGNVSLSSNPTLGLSYHA